MSKLGLSAARRAAAGGALLPILLLGCASYSPPSGVVGMSIADVERVMGPTTNRYMMPDGLLRAEFARGPMGRHTWMLDLDAQGRVARSEQVLSEAMFATIQDGERIQAVQRRIGRPAETRQGGRQGGEVWNWRFPTNDCLWFETAVIDGVVRQPWVALDPRCDVRSDTARD